MTEEQIKMFKDMVKSYWATMNIFYSEDTNMRNDLWNMLAKLEELTGQPVTDWT